MTRLACARVIALGAGAVVALWSGPGLAGPPCKDSGARLAADARVKKQSACGGAADALNLGDVLTLRAGRSVRYASGSGGGMADVVCSNNGDGELRVAVEAGPPVRLAPAGKAGACRPWANAEYQCADGGVADALTCAAYPRRGTPDFKAREGARVALAVRALPVRVPGDGKPPPFDPYKDARFARWAKDCAAGRLAAAAQGAEQDLVAQADLPGGQHHPFAAHVWLVAHRDLGDRERALRQAALPLRRALGALPRVMALVEAERHRELLAEFPEGRLAFEADPWVHHYLRLAAVEVGRDRLAVDWAHAALVRWPEDHLAAALIADLLRRSPALWGAGPRPWLGKGALDGKTAGRYLATLLPVRPADPWVDLLAAEEWLRERPRDAAALRRKAAALAALERWREAAAAWGRAAEIDPFVDATVARAAALLRGAAGKEARAVVAARARALAARHPDVATSTETLWAQALAAAGQGAAAHAAFGKALGRAPRDERLLAAALEHELAAGKPAGAVRLAETLVVVAPRRARHRVLRQWALQAAGRSAADVATAFASADTVVDPRTPAFYAAGAQALAAAGRAPEALALADQALAEYPGHVGLRRTRALALAKGGQLREAVATLLHTVPDRVPGALCLEWLATWAGAPPGGRAQAAAALRTAALAGGGAAAWDVYARVADASPAAVWDEVRARPEHRLRLWPFERHVEALLAAGAFDEAQRVAAEAEKTVGWQGTPGDKLRARLLPVRVELTRADAKRLPPARRAALARAVAEYQAGGGYPSEALRLQAALLEAEGKRPAAARARADAARVAAPGGSAGPALHECFATGGPGAPAAAR